MSVPLSESEPLSSYSSTPSGPSIAHKLISSAFAVCCAQFAAAMKRDANVSGLTVQPRKHAQQGNASVQRDTAWRKTSNRTAEQAIYESQ